MRQYKFWIENKTDSEVEYTEEQLIEKFREWLKTKDDQWLFHYGYYQVTTAFIGEKKGLNAVCEEADLLPISKLLKDVYKEHLYGEI